ncbi:MAG TPA: hypothetical protein VK705_00585 [Ferruginibacter sp.]|jgi:hypothetical protein|nr:hypothetical protein [Ferruginibacter sp.]
MKEKTGQASHITAENKKSLELKKSKTHIVVEILHYIPNSVVSKSILKKTNGNITIVSRVKEKYFIFLASPYLEQALTIAEFELGMYEEVGTFLPS